MEVAEKSVISCPERIWRSAGHGSEAEDRYVIHSPRNSQGILKYTMDTGHLGGCRRNKCRSF